ncbi:MAG: DeoR/GlpR family DNA-binding transcription regulator [Clostridiales bacterium]|nr:DeoR/GlpR family DNA-binding transcription regulator [Clostridiales bacterium]
MKASRTCVNSRREKILESVRENGNASVNNLSDLFQVSQLTIRRDLQYLEDHRLLERFYGGARFTDSCEDQQSADDQRQFRREKIARYAAGLVDDGDSIFINTSSTALAMVKYITRNNIKVFTNNGNIINEKIPSGVTVFLLGGELRYKKGAMVGDFAMNNLMQMTARKCFIGCGGIDPDTGMTTELLNEVNLNRTMFERASEVAYFLAEGSKFGKRCSFVSCPPQLVTNIITDGEAPPQLITKFRKMGTQVYQIGQKAL